MSEIEVNDIEDVPTTAQKFSAELLGTFVLVLGGVGTAVLSGGDYVATGLAFGLTVVVMAYAFGRVSGGHFNPGVTLGAALGGRLPWRLSPIYLGAQLVGGLLAGAVLFGLLHGFADFTAEGNMGANSFGDEGSGYAWWAAFLLEMLLTAIFLFIILGVTDSRNQFQAFMGPLAIGLALTLIHFVSMSATGTSVNPARSIGVGVFAGTDAIIQLWLFIVAPLVGAAIAGLLYPILFGHGDDPVEGSGLNFGGGRKSNEMAWAPPANYEQQWNQGQPQQWQPGPPQHGAPQQQWGQPQQQSWGQPQQPAPTPPPAQQQSWGQPAQQDPYAGGAAAPQPGGPQHWGSPGDDEDGRTQVRPSE